MDATKVLLSVSERVTRLRRSAALATLISSTGSTPQSPGAKIAVFGDGTTLGTIGGGAVEFELLEVMRGVLRAGGVQCHDRHLTRDLGMCCGGSMKFFVERIEPPPRLVFFGAGHIAKPCCTVAEAAGFEVFVVDDRDELNSASRFPQAQRLLRDGDEALRTGTLQLGESDYVVICTHSHRLDEAILAEVARYPVAYLGMIGSHRKAMTIRARVERKFPGIDLARLRSPVGLALGAVDPGEIAVAIVAELVQLRRGGAANPSGLARPEKKAPMGIVLAAGASSRMGFPKALGRLDGRTVLETIVSSMRQGGCEKVVVVIGEPHAKEICAAVPSLRYVINKTPEGGMLSSLASGVRHAESSGSDAVLVALLDQPRIEPTTVAHLLRRLTTDSSKYLVPTHLGRRGHPFVLRLPLDLSTPTSHTTLREVLSRCGDPVEVAVEDPGILDDLDTPTDALQQGVRKALLHLESS